MSFDMHHEQPVGCNSLTMIVRSDKQQRYVNSIVAWLTGTTNSAAVLRTGLQEEFKAYGRAGALRPPSARRLLGRVHVVLSGTVTSPHQSGRGDGRAGGRQTQMVEDRLHRPGLREVGEHDAAAAAGAVEHVVAEDAPQQLGPRSA